MRQTDFYTELMRKKGDKAQLNQVETVGSSSRIDLDIGSETKSRFLVQSNGTARGVGHVRWDTR